MRPIDLAEPNDNELRRILQKAEMALTAGGDVVNEDDDDDRRGGPGSESD